MIGVVGLCGVQGASEGVVIFCDGLRITRTIRVAVVALNVTDVSHNSFIGG